MEDFITNSKLSWKGKIKALFHGGRKAYLKELWDSDYKLRMAVYSKLYIIGNLQSEDFRRIVGEDNDNN